MKQCMYLKKRKHTFNRFISYSNKTIKLRIEDWGLCISNCHIPFHSYFPMTVGIQLSNSILFIFSHDSWYPTVTFHCIHIFSWLLRCSLFGPPVYYISNPDQACFKWQFVNKIKKTEEHITTHSTTLNTTLWYLWYLFSIIS